ncbi:hypothetical protein DFH28DRAFT_959127 [Melampsora americana]|nr:hypothetical protein DFH28DRAFT_959127 [Melampsora americana]
MDSNFEQDSYQPNSSSINQSSSNDYFINTRRPISPSSSPNQTTIDEKTIRISTPTPFQRLYRQLITKPESNPSQSHLIDHSLERIPSQDLLDSSLIPPSSPPSSQSLIQTFDIDEHHLSSIANHTVPISPIFGFQPQFNSSNHQLSVPSDHLPIRPQSAQEYHPQERVEELNSSHRSTSAPPFNKTSSFINLGHVEPITQDFTQQYPNHDTEAVSLPPTHSIAPVQSPSSHLHKLPIAPSVPAQPPWKSSVVKTPSKLQYSYTPSSPSNTTGSDLQSLSFVDYSIQSPSQALHPVDPDASYIKQESHDHSLDSHTSSPPRPPSQITPPRSKSKSDYQLRFIDSPVTDPDPTQPATISGEVRIFNNNNNNQNNQNQSIFTNPNGKSFSQLHDQSLPHFDLGFSSPVTLRDYSIIRNHQISTENDSKSESSVTDHPDGCESNASEDSHVSDLNLNQPLLKTAQPHGNQKILTYQERVESHTSQDHQPGIPLQIDGASAQLHSEAPASENVGNGHQQEDNVFETGKGQLGLPSFSPFRVPQVRPGGSHSTPKAPVSPLALRRKNLFLDESHNNSNLSTSNRINKPILNPIHSIRRPLTPALSDTSSGYIEIHVDETTGKRPQSINARVPHQLSNHNFQSRNLHKFQTNQSRQKQQDAKKFGFDDIPVLDQSEIPTVNRTNQSGPNQQTRKKLNSNPSQLQRFFGHQQPGSPSQISFKSDNLDNESVSVYHSMDLSMVTAPEMNEEDFQGDETIGEPAKQLEDINPEQRALEQDFDDHQRQIGTESEHHQPPPPVNNLSGSVTRHDLNQFNHRYAVLMSVAESLRQELSIKNEMLRLIQDDKEETERSNQVTVEALNALKRKVKEAAENQRTERIQQSQKLEAIVNKLTNQIGSLNKLNETGETKWSMSLGEVMRLKSQFEEARSSVLTFQPLLESYRDSNSELEERNRTQTMEIERCYEEIKKLNERLEGIQEEKEVVRFLTPVKKFNKLIEEPNLLNNLQNKDLMKLKSEVQSKSQEILGLKNRYTELEIRYNEQIKRGSKVESVHDERVRDLEIALQHSNQQVQELKNLTSLSSSSSRIKELEKALEESNQQVFELSKNLSSSKTKEENEKELEREVKESQERLKKMIEKDQKADKLKETLRHQEAELRLENEKLKEEIKGMEIELITLQSGQKEIKEKYQIQEEKLSRVEVNLNQTQTQLELEIQRVQTQSDEMTKLKEIQKRLENKLKEFKEMNQKLRFESADREVKITSLRKTKVGLKEDIEGLNIALEAKQQEVEYLKREKQFSKSKNGMKLNQNKLEKENRMKSNEIQTDLNHQRQDYSSIILRSKPIEFNENQKEENLNHQFHPFHQKTLNSQRLPSFQWI